MADLTDVENAIVAVIGGALYPNGGSNPSVTGDAVRIYPGWPNASQLDADIAAGRVHVSVFPPPGMERNVTRYRRDEEPYTAPVHTLTATVNGNQVTIGGTVSTPQNVIVLAGQGLAFPYGVQAGDTLNTIAAALAALIAAAFPGTTSAGSVITVAGKPGLLRARVAASGQVYIEQRRQQRSFDVSVWAPTPAQRTAVAKVVDLALASIDWLVLADRSKARIIYESSHEIDDAQRLTIYRRCLKYAVEYATAAIVSEYEIGDMRVTTTGGPAPDNVNPAGPAVEVDY